MVGGYIAGHLAVCLFPSLFLYFLVCLVWMLIVARFYLGVRLASFSFKACLVIFLHVYWLPCHFKRGISKFVTINNHGTLDLLYLRYLCHKNVIFVDIVPDSCIYVTKISKMRSLWYIVPT